MNSRAKFISFKAQSRLCFVPLFNFVIVFFIGTYNLNQTNLRLLKKVMWALVCDLILVAVAAVLVGIFFIVVSLGLWLDANSAGWQIAVALVAVYIATIGLSFALAYIQKILIKKYRQYEIKQIENNL
jgi:lysylphosphatidylglycerol synthetase-like protein (DUF2156 family)